MIGTKREKPSTAPVKQTTFNPETTLIICFLGLSVFFVLLVRTAWQPDDTYTAWRLVDNFVHGFGLRNNIDERVQTFTSTLWTMLNAAVYCFSGNIYYTSIVLSLASSLLAVWVAALPYRKAATQLLFLFGSVILSISFMDYSVSGFENPLGHLILATFVYFYFFKSETPTQLFALFFLSAMAALNRLDTPLFYIPALILAFYRSEANFRTRLKCALLGLSPLIAWHLFALIYFGFPLQNAAYAKRFNGIPTAEFVRAGIDYYMNSLERDPITLVTTAAALIISLRSRDKRLRVFGYGIVGYMLYVLYVGGDYMSGRFFSMVFLASVLVLLQSGLFANVESARVGLVGVVALGCLGIHPTFTTGKDYGSGPNNGITSEFLDKGIADERASWYQYSGLLFASRRTDMPRSTPFDYRSAASGFVASFGGAPCVGRAPGNAGYFSYFTRRDCHVYDLNGQVDPLMARVPNKYDRGWRQGHLFKDPVPGYHETLVTGRNQIVDPDLAAYYDKLRLITRGDIWSWERMKTIVAMNLGQYDYHLRAYAKRNNISW